MYRIFNKLPSVQLGELLPSHCRNDLNIKIILDHINLPPHQKSWTTRDGVEIKPFHDDVTPIYCLTTSLHPELVLEIGTSYGNLSANICMWTDADIVTVNALSEQISGGAITHKLEKADIGKVYRKYNFTGRVKQLYFNTLDIDFSRYFSENSIDIAIIDGCHDTDYVINDFLKAVPYVKKGGIILLHDTHPSMVAHLGGSYKACVYLRKKRYDIIHIRDTWWAYWKNA